MRDMIPEPDYSDEANKNGQSSALVSTTTTTTTATSTTSGPNATQKPVRSPSPTMNVNMKLNAKGKPQFDDYGLVLPRKPNNPYVESSERKNLHKEMLWNQKMGKNVLDQKNELEKVMALRKDEAKKKELNAEKLTRRSSLELRLEEQQLKLKLQEECANQSPNSASVSIDEPKSEFLKIYSKVKSATNNNVTNINNNNESNNNNNLERKCVTPVALPKS